MHLKIGLEKKINSVKNIKAFGVLVNNALFKAARIAQGDENPPTKDKVLL